MEELAKRVGDLQGRLLPMDYFAIAFFVVSAPNLLP
jgi:hypothetical protein